MGSKIAILLSTYNGVKYLDSFLNSLFQQTDQNFILFVRDDGSQDETVSIVHNYQNRNHDIVLLDSRSNIGAVNSFGELINFVYHNFDLPYFMFADQDDIWVSNKIALTREKMTCEEKNNEPVLVHTDLRVVDRDLNIIAHSFWKYQNINPNKTGLNQLLMQNVITGCTMMINRELAKKCLPIPSEVIMHDWWIGLVASMFAKIVYVDTPAVIYRQHGNNEVGAKKFNLRFVWKRAFSDFSLSKNLTQAQLLYDSFKNQCNPQQISTLQAFLKLSKLFYIRRVYILLKYGFLKNGLIRNLGLLLKI